MALGPSERYYASLVGAWSGTFTFAVTDEASLAAQPFGTRALVRASAKVSPMRFSTTLEGEGRLWLGGGPARDAQPVIWRCVAS